MAGLFHIHYFGACLMNIELLGSNFKATENTIFAYSVLLFAFY